MTTSGETRPPKQPLEATIGATLMAALVSQNHSEEAVVAAVEAVIIAERADISAVSVLSLERVAEVGADPENVTIVNRKDITAAIVLNRVKSVSREPVSTAGPPIICPENALNQRSRGL